jgi:class III poly(R)-hydroxyalkanoic acid synthase PhaE subunit
MNTQWPGGIPDAGFDALARQYWTSWGDAMRGAASAASPTPTAGAVPTWQDAVDWWSKLAQGDSRDANSAVDRFNAQARDWYGQMQRVAAQFAGRDPQPADIAAEWKRAMAAFGANPFQDIFVAMQGEGAQGLEQWTKAAAPWLDAWRREATTTLGMPTFGIGREQQERWQKLLQAQMDYQQEDAAYNALMLKATQNAYARFEKMLAERAAPGKQLTTARALFDLWIEAAEDAYAEVALSPDFRNAYAARVNAQMRLRQAVQGEVERMSNTMGMPTRGDMDTAFRKIDELERALRTLRDRMEADGAQPSGAASQRTQTTSSPNQEPVAGSGKKAAAKAPAKNAASKGKAR